MREMSRDMSSWKQFKARVIAAAQRFMQGRYGADQLGLALIWVSFVLVLLGGRLLYGIPSLLGTAGWIWSVWRLCSRNIEKRRSENVRFLTAYNKVKRPVSEGFARFRSRKKYVYFTCPKCGMKLRLPRGVGEVTVTCRQCGSKFEKKA